MGYKGTTGFFEFTIGHGGRSAKGTEVHVRVDPMIAEFVKGLGSGECRPLQPGGLWYPISPDKGEYYAFGNGEIPAPQFDGYALDMVSKPLVVDNIPTMPQAVQVGQQGGLMSAVGPGETVNLSFLRFKGIGDEAGVKFGMKVLYSPGLMEILKARITRSCRQLCRDYIVPVSMRMVIVNED